MDLQYQLTEEKLVVPMPREVDHHIAKTMSREIDFLIDSWHVRNLVFDFSHTDFMDSSGIGILIGRKRMMDLYRGEVCASNLGERLYEIFKKSGLTGIIRILDEEVERDG